MKHILFIILLCLCFQGVFAQDSSDTLRPVAGDKVMTIGIINNSAFWAYKKYKTESVAYRFSVIANYKFNPASSSTSTTTYALFPDSVDTQTSSSKSNMFGI
jgi:hypothetical protein